MSGLLKNFFAFLPKFSKNEIFETILNERYVTIERIVSLGQATPQGQWLEGKKGEWVLLLKGKAGLIFKDEGIEYTLNPGDYLNIPAGVSHRVSFTDPNGPTVWLAVHYD